MKRINLLMSVAILTLLSACVSTNATMLSSKAYPPITPEEVTIYLSEEDIPGEFERIAIINASGSSSYTNENQMFEAVRKKAAELGANGVLYSRPKEPSAGAKVAAAFVGVDTQRKSEMVAIFVHK